MKRFVADTPAASRSAPNLKTRVPLRYLWLSIVVAPCLAGVGYSTHQAAGTTSPQQPAPRLLTYSDDVDSMVTWPVPRLLKAIRKLNGLEPDESQTSLPGILLKVGADVKAFFENFPNTVSVERISTEGLKRPSGVEAVGAPSGPVWETHSQKFEYLALARPVTSGVGLDEYRTNSKGEVVEPGGSEGSYFVTKGFVSMPLHFYPDYQADSTFRYLGRQVINKRQTYVVAFAQRPGRAHVVGRISVEGTSILVLVQGIAWIDSTSYQILLMHTDLLKSEDDTGLKTQSTEIEFEEVSFKESPQVFWLPREVVVIVDWKGNVYRNHHHYSNFKLFTVRTEEKGQPLEGAPPEHHNPD